MQRKLFRRLSKEPRRGGLTQNKKEKGKLSVTKRGKRVGKTWGKDEKESKRNDGHQLSGDGGGNVRVLEARVHVMNKDEGRHWRFSPRQRKRENRKDYRKVEN